MAQWMEIRVCCLKGWNQHFINWLFIDNVMKLFLPGGDGSIRVSACPVWWSCLLVWGGLKRMQESGSFETYVEIWRNIIRKFIHFHFFGLISFLNACNNQSSEFQRSLQLACNSNKGILCACVRKVHPFPEATAQNFAVYRLHIWNHFFISFFCHILPSTRNAPEPPPLLNHHVWTRATEPLFKLRHEVTQRKSHSFTHGQSHM